MTDDPGTPIAGSDVRVFTLPLPDVPKPEQHRHAHALMRRLLAAELKLAERALVIERDQHGKPYLPGGELQFNLSHSGRFALVAVSRTLAVGVDVQQHRQLRDLDWWRRRLCAPRELQHVQARANPDATETPQVTVTTELLRLWTRKEAVLKASGEGVVRDLNTLDVLDEQVLDPVHGRFRCLQLPSPAEGYLAAVAFKSE